MLRQTSLAKLGLSVGGLLTIVGFSAYFMGNATLNLVGFFYGIPLLLGGLALQSTELKPIAFTQPTPANILTLREQQATPTQNQVRSDVTRYRYGQNGHLDSALDYLKLGDSEDDRPVLVGLREIATDGAYTLVLEFESPNVPLETWQEKQEKMTRFFGPGVRVELQQLSAERIDVALVTTPPESAVS